MLRIAYLIDCLRPPIGGTERQLFTAIRGLDPDRFAVSLFTLQDDPWMDSLSLPCPVQALGFRSLVGPDPITRGRRFVSHCRSQEVDIVQTFFRDANIVGTLWARAARVPTVIASRRNIGTGYWHNAREVWMLRRLARLTDHYIANSEAAARVTSEKEGVPREKITVLPNCLDPDLYVGLEANERRKIKERWRLPPESTVVGSVSNLRSIKNPGLLVEAARLLHGSFPELRFVIMGEGNLRGELESRIRQYGLEDHFVLPGTSTRVHEDIQAFDVAVLTSWGESSPNAVLEYMAAGRPSVVSHVGGNGELIDDAHTGFLFDPHDLPAFVSRIADLVSDEELRARLGDTARRRVVEHNSCAVVIPQLGRIYESISKQRAQREVRA